MKVFPPVKDLEACLSYFAIGQRIIINHYDPDVAIAPECDYSGVIERIGLDSDGTLHMVIGSKVDGGDPVLVVLRIPTMIGGFTQLIPEER